jgi:hypothetical protein
VVLNAVVVVNCSNGAAHELEKEVARQGASLGGGQGSNKGYGA